MGPIATFSILMIRQAATFNTNMENEIIASLEGIIDFRKVTMQEFQTYTRSKAIPRYIMVAKEEMRKKIEQMKNTLVSSPNKIKPGEIDAAGQFTKHSTGESDKIDSPFMMDPTYAVLDIHGIKTESGTPMTVVSLSRNPIVPIYNHMILKRMARKLARTQTCDVMAVEEAANLSYVEHCSEFSNGNVVVDKTVAYGQGLLTEFKNRMGVDINAILKGMDDNIDILMAPHDLEEYRQIMTKLNTSRVFLESMGAHNTNPDQKIRNDYIDLLKEISITKENLRIVGDRILIDPPVSSIYIKITNPPQLKDFASRPLENSSPVKLNG